MKLLFIYVSEPMDVDQPGTSMPGVNMPEL